MNCTAIVMLANLLSHMQHTLWHIPLAARLLAVALVTAAMGGAAVPYVALAPTHVGRLMIDSLVHTLTVARRGEPAVAGACLAGLDDMVATAAEERLQYGAPVIATFSTCGQLGVGAVGADKSAFRKPELGLCLLID